MRRSLSLLLATLATLATTAAAQSPTIAKPDPTGTITGHVFCADTNQPGRFAQVSLQAIPTASKSKPTATEGFRPAVDTSGAGRVQTGLDGSFTLSHVKPGSYYVVVDKDGYLGPRDIFNQKQLDDASPEMLALRAESIPHVTVEANHTERAEVRLERGASISGTVLYDDGTPASGLQMSLMHKDPNGKWIRSEYNGKFTSWVHTDDRGNFRISSLLAGDYIVNAELSMASSKTTNMKGPGNMTIQLDLQTYHFTLPFYGTGTAHLSEAKPVTLRAGQDTPGQDMIIPIAKLHKLTGQVAAGRDAHFVNAAKVSLVTREDNKELASTDISREDGLFHFEFVPDGDYILKVTEARDVVWELPAPTKENPLPTEEKERVLARFGNTEQTILLRGDQLGTVATISPDSVPTPATPKSTQKINAASDTPDATPQSKPAPTPEATPQLKTSVASASL